jgi:hypothetical protein
MSDRTVCLTVVLDDVYRVDDAENIISAIRMIKGVSTVRANVSNIETYMAYDRARTDLEKIIWNAFHPKNKIPEGA